MHVVTPCLSVQTDLGDGVFDADQDLLHDWTLEVVTQLPGQQGGLIVAAFSKTVSQAFVIANFPLGVFMFLSGAIFPIPSITLFQIAGQPIALCDFLPPRHAVIALNKILTLGAGLEEVAYELIALVVLSVLYFAVGTWIFQRRQMRPT